MEQQKTGVWIDWHGGECPVPGNTMVMVKLVDNDLQFQSKARPANILSWTHVNEGSNIIAYLVIPTYVPPAKPKRWSMSRTFGTFNGLIYCTLIDSKTGARKETPVTTDEGYAIMGMMVNYLNEVAP